MITGSPPFDAVGVGELIAKHIYEAPPRASSLRDIPRSLDLLIERCLAKDRASRFANGTELAAALGALIAQRASDLDVATAPMSSVPSASQGHSTPTPRAAGTTLSGSAMVLANPSPRKRSVILAASGLGIIALAAGSAYIALKPGTTAPEQARPAATTMPKPIVSEVAPDLRPTRAQHQIAQIIHGFTPWWMQHRTAGLAHAAHAPCPSGHELASFASPSTVGMIDPWGHEIVVTCTAQPADQIVGAISAGPDGVVGSADDVVSWQLGPDVTEPIRGPRWAPAPEPASEAAPERVAADHQRASAARVHAMPPAAALTELAPGAAPPIVDVEPSNHKPRHEPAASPSCQRASASCTGVS